MGSERILLATRSAHKAAEIAALLPGALAARLIGLDEAGFPVLPEEDEVERFDTFLDNARAKARHFLERTGLPTLADDSGLEVEALAGAPGVRTKRFAADAGALPAGMSMDEANNRQLLRRLEGQPEERRGARYVCAAVMALPDGGVHAALGTCAGGIATAAAGSGGFGYDPIFLVPALGRTFGQATAAEKARLSHRAHAFRALGAGLGGVV